MFENVGKRIKEIAKLLFAIGVVLSVLLFIVMLILAIPNFDYGDEALGVVFLLIGIFSIIIGPVISWLSVLLLYAFGELVQKTCNLEKTFCEDSTVANEDDGPKWLSFKLPNIKKEISEPKAKKCKYCGKKVELSVERCDCGCIAFDSVYAEDANGGNVIEEVKEIKCEVCGSICDKVTCAKITDKMGIRYRNLCDACIEKYNAIPKNT